MSNPSETKRGAEGKSSASPEESHSPSRPRARDVDRHGNWVPYARYEHNTEGYPVWRQSGGARYPRRAVSVHRLVAVAEYGFDAVVDKEVHHKNGVVWDNRPENLQPMDPAEHRRHHREGVRDTTNTELLLDLRAGRVALGYRPRTMDYGDLGAYSTRTIIRRFGSFEAALEAAGIDPETGEMVPLEEWVERREAET